MCKNKKEWEARDFFDMFIVGEEIVVFTFTCFVHDSFLGLHNYLKIKIDPLYIGTITLSVCLLYYFVLTSNLSFRFGNKSNSYMVLFFFYTYGKEPLVRESDSY